MLRVRKRPSPTLLAIVSTAMIGTVISLMVSASPIVHGQLGLNPVPTFEEVIATYVVRIPPGAA